MHKNKNNQRRNPSLSIEYFGFATIVSVIIISYLVWILWWSYNHLILKKNHKYSSDAIKIQEVLSNSFTYTSNLMRFIGTRIAVSGKNDSESVTSILQTKIESDEIKDIFPWTVFEFVNSQNYVIASTAGVTKPYLKVTASQRPWILSARAQPWILHLNDPDIGIVSHEYIIPGGYGITDQNKKFLGIISVGFSIAKLKKAMANALILSSSNNVNDFLLFTKDLKFITSSKGNKESFNDLFRYLQKNNVFLHDFGQLETKINHNNITYEYYKVMRSYNFVVLIGQNKQYLKESLEELMEPQVVKAAILGISFLILLYFFRMKIVNPMVVLSEKAKLLSRGNLDIEMPKVNSREAYYLVEALEMVKGSFQRENAVRQQLFQTNNQIKLVNLNLEQKVDKRTMDLQQALATKTEFLNNISHEICTPLQGITGLSEGLVEHWYTLDDTKKLEIVEHIASNNKRLLSLMGNLLNLSKFTAKKMLLTFQMTSLTSLVETLITESMILYIKDKNIKIDFVKNNNIVAMADHEKITQVLRNLFVNAIKFSPDTSAIIVALSQIEIDGHKGVSKKAVHFSISDSGIGIPENELKTIFEPFTQSSRTKTKAGGTGLGLAICHAIIIAHHGKIWAKNNKTGGATFNFIIPSSQNEQLKNERRSVKNHKQVEVAKQTTILMIDDEETCLINMELLLHQSQYTLVKINNGLAGLRYLMEHGDEVDLVLLDLMMPGVHGLDILAEIRKQPNFIHIRVILQTGIADEKTIDQARRVGIDGYIKKPYQKDDVLTHIKTVLSS